MILAFVFWCCLPRVDPRLVGTWSWRLSDDSDWGEVIRFDADGRAVHWIVALPDGVMRAVSHYRWNSDGDVVTLTDDMDANNAVPAVQQARRTATKLWRNLSGRPSPSDRFKIRSLTADTLELESSPESKSYRMTWHRSDEPSFTPPAETRR